MIEFKNKVAVITGAASGIGNALALKCCQEGMKVVLADIDSKNLARAEKNLSKYGEKVLSVVMDVSKTDEVNHLAKQTLDRFGGVHLLCNNAGVGFSTYLWEHTLNDWYWMMGVNLWGVINGIRTFVPIMIRQDEECHIVNTSSLAGIVPGSGIYGITKHAVVALSEGLLMELESLHYKIGVSVLCPSFVNTNILDCEDHRPLELHNDPLNEAKQSKLTSKTIGKTILKSGRSPEDVAEIVFQGIINKNLYILTDMDFRLAVKRRMRHLLEAFDEFKIIKKHLNLI